MGNNSIAFPTLSNLTPPLSSLCSQQLANHIRLAWQLFSLFFFLPPRFNLTRRMQMIGLRGIGPRSSYFISAPRLFWQNSPWPLVTTAALVGAWWWCLAQRHEFACAWQTDHIILGIHQPFIMAPQQFTRFLIKGPVNRPACQKVLDSIPKFRMKEQSCITFRAFSRRFYPKRQ